MQDLVTVNSNKKWSSFPRPGPARPQPLESSKGSLTRTDMPMLAAAPLFYPSKSSSCLRNLLQTRPNYKKFTDSSKMALSVQVECFSTEVEWNLCLSYKASYIPSYIQRIAKTKTPFRKPMSIGTTSDVDVNTCEQANDTPNNRAGGTG
jgi:hypothetical protein